MTGHKPFHFAYIVKDRSAINYLTAFAERVLVVFEGLASTEAIDSDHGPGLWTQTMDPHQRPRS